MTVTAASHRSWIKIADFLIYGLALFFCAGTFLAQLPWPAAELPPVHEQFEPQVQSIKSVDAAKAYVSRSNEGASPAALADAADEFVRRRFVHGYSFFTPGQNWLAYLAGFLWLDLRSPVLPDDILQHRRAACSQQVIVYDAIMRQLGFETAVVRFQGHMTAAVKIGNDWRVYDADREISPRSYSYRSLEAGDPAVLAIYRNASGLVDLPGQVAHGDVRMTDANGNPARHASLFDAVTKALSRYGWAVSLALALGWMVHRRRGGGGRLATAELAS
jgi:hypothetical protein